MTHDPDECGARPPEEAYSRVTNAERFRPLHAHALAALARLEATHAVVAHATFAPLPGLLGPVPHARPPVTLVPSARDAAPLAVAFTAFPSLVVRAGRWCVASFPACGCDACDEAPDEEAARFDDLVAHVVAGHFTESLVVPRVGEARLAWTLGVGAVAGSSCTTGGELLARDVARTLVGDGSGHVAWCAWRLRDRGGTARTA